MAIKLIKGEPPEDIPDGHKYIYLKNNKIYINNCVLASPYHCFYDKNNLSDKLLGKISYTQYKLYSKEDRKLLVDALGCSPSTIQRVFKAIISQLVMDGLKPYITRLCLSSNRIKVTRKGKPIYKKAWRWDFDKIDALRASLIKIKQLDVDGLMHLAPLVHTYNECPKELKVRFGKSVWKHLSKNSFTRNKLLIDNNVLGSLLIHVPSTILKYCKGIPTGTWNYSLPMYTLYKSSKLKYKNFTTEHAIMYLDTYRMAYNLGKHPRPKDWDDLQRLHDAYMIEQLERDSAPKSNAPIIHIIEPFVLTTEQAEYKCTPLISDSDLYLEGIKMKHCIYSYLENVRKGTYYVVHIENTKTKEHSTLGITTRLQRFDGSIKYKLIINQHYAARNQSTNNTEIEKQVVEHIDNIIKEKEDVYNNITLSSTCGAD